MTDIQARRALMSVSDKTGLETFAQELSSLDFEIVSTGGTARYLTEHGISVIDVSEYTGFPEIMGGRVKTLHPKVHAAILGRPDQPGDAAAIREHAVIPFELVVCNLYPFENTIARENVTVDEAIEQIDIGGPSMVRAAAKNHAYVGIVSNAAQYERVVNELRQGSLSEAFRRELAAAAFEMTARYDRAIADYMSRITTDDDVTDGEFPNSLSLQFQLRDRLRYGENPHQGAAVYVEPTPPAASLAGANQKHGKELSFNNLLDLETAMTIAREFDSPAAVVIKHNNPCGCGTATSLAEAFDRAYEGDPVSAFGSIVGVNRPLDADTAQRMCQPNRFIEAVIAPEIVPDAFEILTTTPTWKNSVRLLECREMNLPVETGWDFRRIGGGLLVQARDDQPDPQAEWRVVTERQPTDAELNDLRFAWTVCKHVKSNAILFAANGAVVGVGAGQMSRVDSVFIAGHKAGDRSRGAVLASDAFFPFRDGVDAAATAGITAVIQPGGSRRDSEVIEACNEHNLAMIFTGRRHFRH